MDFKLSHTGNLGYLPKKLLEKLAELRGEKLIVSKSDLAKAEQSIKEKQTGENLEKGESEPAEELKKETSKNAKSKDKKEDPSKDESFLDKIVDAFRPKNGETQK